MQGTVVRIRTKDFNAFGMRVTMLGLSVKCNTISAPTQIVLLQDARGPERRVVDNTKLDSLRQYCDYFEEVPSSEAEQVAREANLMH